LGQDDFSIGLHTFELGAAFALASDLEDDFLPAALDEKIRSLPANSCKLRRWSNNCILVIYWPR
jgi:DNA-binding IclR family transcriptional regulator